MRVLLLGPYPPPYGGVQTHIVALRRIALEQGHHIEVANITRHRGTPGDGIHYPRSPLGLIRLLVTQRYDVLHLHVGGQLSARVLALALILTLVPWSRAILTLHSGGFPSSAAGMRLTRRSLAGLVLRRFDAVVGVNNELVEFFHRLGLNPTMTRLLRPSPSVRSTGLDHDRKSDEIQRFMDEHDPLIVTVGLLEAEYDLPLQIKAMGEITNRHPSAGLLIVGSGSMRGSLEELRQSSPEGGSVLLAGDVPHKRTLFIMSQASVFLRTTHFDGDAISVREALELGVPVIATDNGMRPPGVRLIPLGDCGELACAVNRVLAEPPHPDAGTHHETAAPHSDLDRVLGLYKDVVG